MENNLTDLVVVASRQKDECNCIKNSVIIVSVLRAGGRPEISEDDVSYKLLAAQAPVRLQQLQISFRKCTPICIYDCDSLMSCESQHAHKAFTWTV